MRVVGIIQARVGSTRFPNKVLANLGGMPIIKWVLKRSKLIPGIDEIILAIPSTPENEVLEKIGKEEGVVVFKGSENNLSERFYLSLLYNKMTPQHVLRITADNPLLSPRISGETISNGTASEADYFKYENLPLGITTELLSYHALAETYRNATKDVQKEHISPYILENSHRFRVFTPPYHKENLSHIRLTVDRKEDLEFIRRVVEILYEKGESWKVEYEGILTVLRENPQLLKINSHVKQKNWREEG
jgi:spore coat polysaccharide biosynthesis protein SpsF